MLKVPLASLFDFLGVALFDCLYLLGILTDVAGWRSFQLS